MEETLYCGGTIGGAPGRQGLPGILPAGASPVEQVVSEVSQQYSRTQAGGEGDLWICGGTAVGGVWGDSRMCGGLWGGCRILGFIERDLRGGFMLDQVRGTAKR